MSKKKRNKKTNDINDYDLKKHLEDAKKLNIESNEIHKKGKILASKKEMEKKEIETKTQPQNNLLSQETKTQTPNKNNLLDIKKDANKKDESNLLSQEPKKQKPKDKNNLLDIKKDANKKDESNLLSIKQLNKYLKDLNKIKLNCDSENLFIHFKEINKELENKKIELNKKIKQLKREAGNIANKYAKGKIIKVESLRETSKINKKMKIIQGN